MFEILTRLVNPAPCRTVLQTALVCHHQKRLSRRDAVSNNAMPLFSLTISLNCMARVAGWIAIVTVVAGNTLYGQESAEKVSTWVQQLDADQFVVRKRATENLIAADASAVEPVVQAVTDGSLEVVVRGIMILRTLALSEDKETADAAYAGLERLSSSQVTTSARRAAAALVTVAEMREMRALQLLQSFGAKLGQGVFRVGKTDQITLPQIAIGPGWKGQDKDLALLKWVVNYQAIALEGPGVTNDWLKQISQLEHLRGIENQTCEHYG